MTDLPPPPSPNVEATITFTHQRNLHPDSVLRETIERYDNVVGWSFDASVGYYFLTHRDGWVVGVPLEGRRVLIVPSK